MSFERTNIADTSPITMLGLRNKQKQQILNRKQELQSMISMLEMRQAEAQGHGVNDLDFVGGDTPDVWYEDQANATVPLYDVARYNSGTYA